MFCIWCLWYRVYYLFRSLCVCVFILCIAISIQLNRVYILFVGSFEFRLFQSKSLYHGFLISVSMNFGIGNVFQCVCVCVCACNATRNFVDLYLFNLVVEPNLHRCARCIPTPKINFSNFEIYHFSKRHSNDTLKIIHY